MMPAPPNGRPPSPAVQGQPSMPGGGAPGAQPAPVGDARGGGPIQVPPEFARHIDPKNPVQMLLMQRVDKLTPQDLQAVNTGISPPAVMALKKVIPEIGFLLDMIGKPNGQAPAAAVPMQPNAGGAPGMSNSVPGLSPPARSRPQSATKLGNI
jgi:hypothetical protein